MKKVTPDSPLGRKLIAKGLVTLDDFNGPLVQRTEHRASTPKVEGSNPSRPTKMNKTEGKHAAYLEAWKRAGVIRNWMFASIKLRLAEKCFYTPDFFVEMADGTFEMHEIKGAKVWDDAVVKYKMARELFPQFRWKWRQLIKGEWIEK